jgi:hypothetical protein
LAIAAAAAAAADQGHPLLQPLQPFLLLVNITGGKLSTQEGSFI